MSFRTQSGQVQYEGLLGVEGGCDGSSQGKEKQTGFAPTMQVQTGEQQARASRCMIGIRTDQMGPHLPRNRGLGGGNLKLRYSGRESRQVRFTVPAHIDSI